MSYRSWKRVELSECLGEGDDATLDTTLDLEVEVRPVDTWLHGRVASTGGDWQSVA